MSKKISDLQKKIAMSTVGKADIRGKEYSTVPLRIELFRKDIMASDVDDMPSIFTRVDMYEDRVVTRAYLAREVDVIIGEDGHEMVQMKGVKSAGTSEENRSASMINKTSAVENSETSAVGRMLGMLGLHGGIMASAEEMEAALASQKVVEIRPVKAKEKSDIKAKEKSDMTVKKFLNKLSKCEKKEAVNSLLLKEKSFFEELKSVSHGDYLELKAQVTSYRNGLPNQGEKNGL